MSKEHFIAAHEKLVEEYLERHPNAKWEDAYEKTAELAYDRMREDLAGLADGLRQREKDKRK